MWTQLRQQLFFENGSYGKLADLGAYYYSGSDGSKTAISAGTLASGVQIVESYGSSYKVVVFRRSLPVAKFKRYVAVVQATGSVYKNLYMCIGTSMRGGTYRSGSVNGSSGAKTTLTITLPSGIDTSKKWGLNFSCILGKSCTSNIKLISLYAYAS